MPGKALGPTCGVELHKLQVLAGKASPGNHGCAITSAGVGRRAAEVGPPIASENDKSAVTTHSSKCQDLLT